MPYEVPRLPLACLPTPIQELVRLSQALDGPRILVKRDDLTGLATGGNKARKLEYLLADAREQGAHTVITTGAAESNHARQTAAAAAQLGLGCVLVLSPMAPAQRSGNLLIDSLVGARIRWTGGRDPYEVMQEVADEERSVGRTPYVIPVGGSNAIGAVGYMTAMEELVGQLRESALQVDHIVFASGSGGTQAGLLVGADVTGFAGRLTGISVAKPAEELAHTVTSIAQLTAAFLGLPPRDLESIVIRDEYRGQGYGIVGEAECQAIRLVARTEGLLLDPVYTGRAMAGLLDMIANGEFTDQDTVLFWHTGGTASLFAYADSLMQSTTRGGLERLRNAPVEPDRAGVQVNRDP